MTRTIGAALALALAATSVLAAEGSGGTVWLALGPFPNPRVAGDCQGFDRDCLAAAGGEAGVRPREGAAAAGSSWIRAEARAGADGSEEIDLLALFGYEEDCLAYVYREIEARVPGEWEFAIGSDDGVKLWVNGRLVHANHIHRAIAPGDDLVVVRLETGKNRILAKVDQGNGGWAFNLRARPAVAPRAFKARGLSIAPASWRVEAGMELLCNPMTVPKAALDAPMTVELLDAKGNVVAEASTRASRPAAIRVPPAAKGALSLRAKGGGVLAGLVSKPRVIVVGKAEDALAAEAAAAREAARSARCPWFDAPASLEFAALIMDGRTDPSLCAMEQRIDAIEEARAIKAAAASRTAPSGTLRLAFRSALDGSLQPYSLYLPSGPVRGAGRPLLVMLHGKGSDDRQGIEPFSRAADAEFVVLAPFGRGDFGYQCMGEADVLEAIAEVESRYRIDPDRVHIAGSSMGAFGTLRFAQLYADRFASASAFAGWTGPQLLDNLHSLPLLLVHGDADDVVPLGASTTAASILRAARCPVTLEVLPGAGHSALTAWNSGDDGRLLDRVRALKREAKPRRLRFSASHLRYRRHYWAEIAELEAGTAGRLDAVIDDERHVSVETEGVAAFALDMRHPALASTGRVVVWVDGASLAVDAGSPRAVFRKDARGRFARAALQTPAQAPTRAPARVNEGGGLLDLYLMPLYIVYGTKGGRFNAELRRGAELLGSLEPDSLVNGGARSGKPRVVSDAAYLALGGKIPASAIFVGSPAQNAALARTLAAAGPDFPAAWEKGGFSVGGERYRKAGLCLVRPYPGREGALMAIIDLPIKVEARKRFFQGVSIAARAFGGFDDDPSGPVLPDLIVMDSTGRAIRSEFSGADWKLPAVVGR